MMMQRSRHEIIRRASFPETDIGNGRRLAEACQGRFRYCLGEGWYEFKDGVWRPSHFDRVVAVAMVVAQQIEQEVRWLKFDLRKGRSEWAKRSCARGYIENMVKCARADDSIMLERSRLDSRRNVLNVQNGTLHIHPSGEVSHRAHHAADFITKIGGACFEREAMAPTWRAAIERAFPDHDVRAYVQRVLGASLLGIQQDQAIWYFVGYGRDGKSTVLNIVKRILGSYAANLDAKVLTDPKFESGGDAPNPRLAALAGDTRLVLVSEPSASARLNEGLIKSLTGGGTISVRALHKAPFEYQPRFRIIVETNHFPTIMGTDDGIWRRIRIVRWPVQIPESSVDLNMEAKLWREAPGILNWLLEGLRQYLEIGLDEPAAVRHAASSHRRAPRDVAKWFAERGELDHSAVREQRLFYEDFQRWGAGRDATTISERQFGQALRVLGAEPAPKHSRSRRVTIRGLRLRGASPTQVLAAAE